VAVHAADHRLRARGHPVYNDRPRAGPGPVSIEEMRPFATQALADVFDLELAELPAETVAGQTLDGLRRSKPVEDDLDVSLPLIRWSRPEHRADQVQDVAGTDVAT
jgi:hypothetical protein